MIRQMSIATLAVAVLDSLSVEASAQFPQGNYQSPLFSQYATQGAGASASAYPAPHYSPYLGGHSYYTYQPLMPHEMMYQHSRNYYNYYNTGGYYGGGKAVNKTSVRWQAGNNHIAPLPFSTGLSGLFYRFNSRRYCLDGECGSSRPQLFRRGGCASGNCGGATYGDSHYEGATESFGCATGNCATKPAETETTKR